MTEITVIDSIMGSGKTQYAIQYMNEAQPFEKFIYITPYLAEVERIKDGVTDRHFIEPNNANDEGRKMRSLKELIVTGENIASTHSLFQTADEELIELLTDSGYTLILDEVMDCVEPVNVRQTDIRRLEASGDIEVINNRVEWKGDPNDDSRYKDIRLLAQAGNLFYHRGKFLVWAFPPSVFRAVDKVILMTYLFKGQMQRYYFDLFRFEYGYKAVKVDGGRYELTEHDIKNEGRKELLGLIDLYEGKLNDVANRKNALSATFLRRANGDVLGQLQLNMYNYFQNIAEAKNADTYFSTLKEVENMVAPRGYKKVMIPVNARATNEHSEKWAIAYIFNRYANPNTMSFFQDNGVSVNEDMLAVSDLLQWVWRSRIRNGAEIMLYLPSSRMRGLLKAWANYEI
ncbi:hypothetical protein ACFSFY_02535 [Sporosarcina siberiensis]|uniref:Uncharacterized protein n=1 Tax=Sporosarcina siberiensis TaxID=1365606 RepID=A0ABW4SBY8_9BACL